MSKHLELLHAHRTRLGAHNVNVNTVHSESLSLNDHIATWVADHVGTMWFCYFLSLLMMGWSGFNILLGKRAFDPYPFSFLFFCLGGIMQSLLMPLLMVSQNLGSRHSETRAELDYHVNQESFARLEQIDNKIVTILERLDTQQTRPIRAVRKKTEAQG